MARTRRVGNRRSQIARNNEPEDIEEVEEIDIDEVEEIEEVDFEDDDSGIADSRASSRASRAGSRAGRRTRAGSSVSGASGRRSARMSNASGRGSSRRSARKELTPEEIEARKRGRKALLNLFIGLIILGGAGFGIFWGLKPNPLIAQADAALNSAKQYLNEMGIALDELDPDKAQESYDEGNKILRVDMLANGGEKINPDDPKLASVEHARRAKSLLERFDDELTRISKVRNRVKAEDNLKMISAKLNGMSKLDDDGLDALEQLIIGYRENPLDPELADSNPVAQEAYSTLIARLTGKEQDIEQERKIRLEKRTVFVEKEVNSMTDKLLGQLHFQKALDHITAEGEKFPDAQLDPIRERVIATAKDKWNVAKQNADGKYKDGISSTNNSAKRKSSLEAAIAGMSTVIEKYGIEDYVSEARELKSKYERALRNLNN